MERLTKSDSDYCHVICGGVNGCPRLAEGEKPCRDYDLYERLRIYENALEAISTVSIDCSHVDGNDLRSLYDLLSSIRGVEFVSSDRKRGHWIHDTVDSEKSTTGSFMISSCQCSECDCYVSQESNFCPSCGAKMN